MNKPFFILCVIISVLSTGCGPSQKARDTTENALFNKWIGQPKTQLVKQWGQPDSLAPDGKNGQILIYKEGLDYMSVMNEKYTGLQYSFRKEMFINADSIIYNWKAWRRK